MKAGKKVITEGDLEARKWDPIFFGNFFHLSFGIFFRVSVSGG